MSVREMDEDCYLPTAEEIRAAIERIQSRWTAKQRENRVAYDRPAGFRFPEYQVGSDHAGVNIRNT